MLERIVTFSYKVIMEGLTSKYWQEKCMAKQNNKHLQSAMCDVYDVLMYTGYSEC